MSLTIHSKYKYCNYTVQRAGDRRQKFNFCRLSSAVNVMLNLSINRRACCKICNVICNIFSSFISYNNITSWVYSLNGFRIIISNCVTVQPKSNLKIINSKPNQKMTQRRPKKLN